MSIASPLAPPAANGLLSMNGVADVPTLSVWRLSVEQYHEMIRTGILHNGDPIELLEGVLVLKRDRNLPHRIAVTQLRDLLMRLVGSGWHVETQEAVTLDTSEPEPDLAVIRGTVRDYPDRHPGPNDIGLVVEVADTSLAQDRGQKKRVYARAGIVEFWIVNLIDEQIEVYFDPTGPVDPSDQAEQSDYRQRLVFTPGQSVPVTLGGGEVGLIAVSQVLP
ncbi:MAG: Uma2 family endonuclease [Planctomycetota bacterium]